MDLQKNGTASDEAEMLNLLGLLHTLSLEEEDDNVAKAIESSTPQVSGTPSVEHPPPPTSPLSVFGEEEEHPSVVASGRTVFTQDEINSMTESEIMAAILLSEEEESRDRSDSFEDVHNDLCPFDVKCPFCGEIMPTFNFPEHVFSRHSDKSGEMHRCGICYLTSNTSMGKVNLVEHLRAEHSDFVAAEAPTFEIGYNNEVIDKDYPGECPICWEPFVAGQSLTILSCLCRYHQKCIEGYWTKDDHKPGDCAVHRDRDVAANQ